MSGALTRRGLVGRAVASAVGASLAGVPAVLASPPRRAVDPVAAMGAEHEHLLALSAPVVEAYQVACADLPGGDRTFATVKIGNLLTNDPDTGASIRKPIMVVTEKEIRDHLDTHRRARIAMWGEDHPTVARVDAECDRLIAELRAEQARVAAIEEAAGIASLDRQLDEMNAAEDALEDKIVQTVATTPSGLLAQMRILARFVEGDYAGTVAKTVIAGLEAMQAREDLA
jgi:hypothetical protein